MREGFVYLASEVVVVHEHLAHLVHRQRRIYGNLEPCLAH
jgi:hypothetical protein